MNLTKRGRYATRAMIELARLQRDKPVPLSIVANCQDISRKYLQQLMAQLRLAGLVRVYKGNKGGYMLARPAEKISILDILKATEGDLEMVDCVTHSESCERANDCEAQKIWQGASAAMMTYLGSMDLESVKNKSFSGPEQA